MPENKYLSAIKRYLNPKNWGVDEYGNEDFSSAFNAAKRAGEKEFIFRNKRYTTESTMTPQQELEVYGIPYAQATHNNALRDRVQRSIYPFEDAYGYKGYVDISDGLISTPLDPYIRAAGDLVMGEKSAIPEGYVPTSIQFGRGELSQDIFDLYLGKPRSTGDPRLSISSYKPTNADNPDNLYYSLANDMLFDDKSRFTYGDDEFSNLEGFIASDHTLGYGQDYTLGRYTINKGQDDKGSYISYYDVWDLAPGGGKGDGSLGIGNPLEFYGRQYYTQADDGTITFENNMADGGNVNAPTQNFNLMKTTHTFAQRAKKIEKKYPNHKKDKVQHESFMDEIKALAEEQEAFKKANNIGGTTNTFPDGGKMPYKDKRGYLMAVGGPTNPPDPTDPIKAYAKYLDNLNKYKTQGYYVNNDGKKVYKAPPRDGFGGGFGGGGFGGGGSRGEFNPRDNVISPNYGSYVENTDRLNFIQEQLAGIDLNAGRYNNSTNNTSTNNVVPPNSRTNPEDEYFLLDEVNLGTIKSKPNTASVNKAPTNDEYFMLDEVNLGTIKRKPTNIASVNDEYFMLDEVNLGTINRRPKNNEPTNTAPVNNKYVLLDEVNLGTINRKSSNPTEQYVNATDGTSQVNSPSTTSVNELPSSDNVDNSSVATNETVVPASISQNFTSNESMRSMALNNRVLDTMQILNTANTTGETEKDQSFMGQLLGSLKGALTSNTAKGIYSDIGTLTPAITAMSSNLAAANNIQDPSLIRPDRVTPYINPNYFDISPMQQMAQDQSSSMAYRMVNSGVDAGTRAQMLNKINQGTLSSLGQIALEGQRINMAEDQRIAQSIDRANEINTANMNQAYIDLANRRDTADQMRRTYRQGAMASIMGGMEDLQYKRMAEKGAPYLEALAMLQSFNNKGE